MIKQKFGDGLSVTREGDLEVWEVPASEPTRYLSHDYFRYIGKFPPQIPQRFISQFAKPGQLILDPMCGGGTVLIEARLAGMRGIGIDVNPVSRLVASVATRALDSDNLQETVAKFLGELESTISGQASFFANGRKGIDVACGSGTTLVESVLLGIPFEGLDINPLSCLIGNGMDSSRSWFFTVPITGLPWLIFKISDNETRGERMDTAEAIGLLIVGALLSLFSALPVLIAFVFLKNVFASH